MIGLMILAYFVLFLLVIIFVIYPLGRVFMLLMGLKINRHESILVSIILGLIAFTLESFLMGMLGLKELIPYFLILQSVFLWIYYFKKISVVSNFPVVKVKPVVLIVIVFSVLLNSLITFPFGELTKNGIRFAGAHTNDNSWHLAVINSLQVSIPPENPIFSGQILKNYHYLVDLQIAVIGSLTKIPSNVLFYQIIGPFYIFLYASMAYLVGRRLTGKDFGGILSVLLLTLSSNWYYLANLIYPSSTRWPSVAWVDYFSSKSVNYPLLFSMIVFFIILFFFLTIEKYNKRVILILSILFGSLISFKAHTAIVLIASLVGIASINLFKREYLFLKIFVLSLIVGFLFFITTFSPGSQGLLIYPFWFIKVMYEAGDRLNFSDWELRRQYLLSLNTIKSYFGVIKLYMKGVAIFLLVNLGVLPTGVFSLSRAVGGKKIVTTFLCLVSFFSFMFTMLFIYNGVAIITIQFFYPAVICLSLLFVMLIASFSKNNETFAVLLSLLIWISFLPGVFYTLKSYSGRRDYYPIAYSDAVRFLSNQENGIVLTAPVFNSSAVIAAYSNKSIFYTDDIIPLTTSDVYSKRAKEVKSFFACENIEGMKHLVSENNIKYVLTDTKSECLDELDYLIKIFDNQETNIYKI